MHGAKAKRNSISLYLSISCEDIVEQVIFFPSISSAAFPICCAWQMYRAPKQICSLLLPAKWTNESTSQKQLPMSPDAVIFVHRGKINEYKCSSGKFH